MAEISIFRPRPPGGPAGRARQITRVLFVLVSICLADLFVAHGQRRTLPPPAFPEALGTAWLWLDEDTDTLRPFVVGSTPAQRVLYYRLPPLNSPALPKEVRVRARGGQCIFADNQLIFRASVLGTYRLNLAKLAARRPRALLAVWHPTALADPGIFLPSSYARAVTASPSPTLTDRAVPHPRPLADTSRHVFILLLLLLGLLYGTLRTVFAISLSRFLRLELATRQGGEVRLAAGALPSTPLTALFGLGFALSFALLIVVVQSSFESTIILRNLFPLSDADILLRVGFYTGLVVAFVLLRFVFLSIVGYVFDLTALVGIQYAAFVRTLLLAGAYIPPTILLHLVLAAEAPTVARRLSDLLLALLLVAVAVRAVVALRVRYALSNLHLFAYLCATEVIPFLVLFRLIVSPLS